MPMGKAIRWTLLLVVLVIFSSGAVAFYTVFFRPSNTIVVPPLRERSVVDAVAEAERLGFAVKIEQVASSLPSGRVLAQSPEPGARVNKNQLVILQVSQGGEQRAVPDLRGQELTRAQRVLQEQGFAVGDVIRIKDGSQPGGVVIAQSPSAPANIPVERKVDLLVSEGGGGRDGKLTIPDVARRSEREAREMLTASGLRVLAVDKIYSPSMSEGMAIETRPSAGSGAGRGRGAPEDCDPAEACGLCRTGERTQARDGVGGPGRRRGREGPGARGHFCGRGVGRTDSGYGGQPQPDGPRSGGRKAGGREARDSQSSPSPEAGDAARRRALSCGTRAAPGAEAAVGSSDAEG